MKFSHSALNSYMTCGHSYKLKYVDKLTSIYKSSSLFFGSAIDEALNFMLLNKDSETVLDDTIKIFNLNWEKNISKYGEETLLKGNPYILFSKYDFDIDFIESSDWAELFAETKVYNKKNKSKIGSPLEIKTVIDERLKLVEFEDLSESDRTFYNTLFWFSLRTKGKVLITSYYKNLIPKIKSVIDVQKVFELEDDEKNILNGVIDFICELEDGTIVVADNKTSSFAYESDSVATSVQLSTYVKVLNLLEIYPKKIDKAAYFVMSKRIEKDITKICKSCGHVGQGAHKTCDNIINDERCGGVWEKNKKFDAPVQLIVDTITDTVQDMVLENADQVKQMIKMGIFNKNFNSCNGKFGLCEYFSKCWKNSDKNLIKRE